MSDIRCTKVVAQIKKAWLVLGCTILLLLMIEGTFSLLFLVRTFFVAGVFDHRANADTYEACSWVQDYYKEFQRSQMCRWEPYVYWRRLPFSGTYIDVDANGIRYTANATAHQAEKDGPWTVFMFGGSTLWGTGARNEFTIPSILAKEIENSQRGPVKITSFAESGYVSTQSVIMLLRQLQKGQIPDLVIFYDGVNDTFSAYQQGAAGLPQNEANRVREFAPSASTLRLIRNTVTNLSVFRFMNGLARRLRRAESPSEPITNPSFTRGRQVDAKSLAADVVATYRANIEIVEALGQHYGFESLFYWQPVVFQKAHLTEYERAEQRSRYYLRHFFEETYNAMQQSGLTENDSVHDLSMIFAETEESYYIDWAHLGESGNGAIAKRMAGDVLRLGNSRE